MTGSMRLNQLSPYAVRSRWSRAVAADHDPGHTPAAVSVASSPATARQAAGERELLGRALRMLPAHQRVPFVLFHFDDMSYREIAARLRVSVSRVKTDLRHGREAIRRFIASAQEAE